MNDTIQRGIIAGFLGSLGDAFIHWFAFFLFRTSTTAHYISQLIFPFKEVTITRLAASLLTHFFAGGLVGIVLVLIFTRFGEDYPYLKGLGLGGILWILHIAVIPNIVSPRPFLFRTEAEVLVDFVAHITYGLVATLYLKKYLVPSNL